MHQAAGALIQELDPQIRSLPALSPLPPRYSSRRSGTPTGRNRPRNTKGTTRPEAGAGQAKGRPAGTLAARLMDPANARPSAEPASCVRVLAPAAGLHRQPADLEVVADRVSTDAVQIKVGAPVRIDGWGGQPSGTGASRSRRIPEGLGAGDRGAAGASDHRLRGPVRDAGPAWPRLVGGRPRHHLERRRRVVRPDKRLIPGRATSGPFMPTTAGAPKPSGSDRPPQQSDGRGSLRARCGPQGGTAPN
ncbi:hypothetical protein ABIB06_004502 [Bradyrhizobium sp. LB8.2]